MPEVRIHAMGSTSPPTSPSWLASLFNFSKVTGPPVVSGGLNNGSFLILACDGVWDVLTNEEAAAFVARNVAAAAAAAAEAHASSIADGANETTAYAAACTAAEAHLSGTAERLSVYVLARTAAAEGVPTRFLLSLKPGKSGRRDVHDDITIVTTFLGGVEGVVKLAGLARS